MSINFNRIVYSPEVQVYILPGNSDTPIDISNDIIEGTITRRTEALSTASFLVQSRRNKENALTLGQLLRPMDRIVVYLKKTKPILIFSGYLDLVPVFQAMPEPFMIEASCTLKRLEFTYWDPNLPSVVEALTKYGFVPEISEGGVSFFSPSAFTEATPTASGPQPAAGSTPQDTGFAAMLNFLLVDVGGWNIDNVWIEPIPEAWMQRAALLFEVNNDWQDRFNLAQDWLKSFLNEGGTSSGGGGSGTVSGGSDSSAKLNNRDKIVSIIDKSIEKTTQSDSAGTDVTGEMFVKYGEHYNIDPRFLAALAAAETAYGTTGQGRDPATTDGYFNITGWGSSGKKFSSREASIEQTCIEIRQKHPNNYYLNGDPNQTIDGFIVHWTHNSQSHKNDIITFWEEMAEGEDKVDPSKPYSIVGQGIGTQDTSGGGGGSDTTNPNADNPSSSTGGANTSLSVYIEAGHSGERQPGYQNQKGDGPTYKKNGNSIVERDANIEMVKEFERQYDALPQQVKDKLSIKFAYDSRPRGWSGDIYISIHHDSSTYNNSQIGFATPTRDSRQGDLSIDGKGLPGPNHYADGGTDFALPSSGEGGRDNVSDDDGLIYNSGQLANMFGNFNPSISGVSITGPKDGTRKGMRNYYGFYYTNSSAAMILELPSNGTRLQYNPVKVGQALMRTVLEYQAKIKGAGKQKAIKAGTEGSGGGGSSTGDDSPASKVIAAIRLAADHNDTEGNWDLGYSMGIGGPANIPSRNPEATIEEVMAKTKAESRCFDCSSFIGAAMRSAGLISKSENQTTRTLEDNSTIIADKTAYKPGHLFVSNTGSGGGHVCIVVSADGKVAECTRPGGSENYGENRGPQYSTVQRFIESDRYKLCEHNKIGTTSNPPSGGSSSGGAGAGSGVDPFLTAKKVAFNVAFNFPGSLLDSVLLTGDRALENDVKLLESVGEICKASMRTFASLPNGDFMAWYPDYFNLSGRNPWLRVSTTEIKSCTISLSDRQLVTHVYVLGNPFGFNQADAGRINLEWYEKLMGSGVVTIERPFILDSFLRPFEDEDLTVDDLSNFEGASSLSPEQIKKSKKRPRQVLEGQGAAYKFLERYGARPYIEKIPTIRHPIFEFFYAYHTFIQKWAEQYITRVELTFMPELFPGMIVELDVNPQAEGYPKTSVTFYVKEVTHSFSYQNGFYTEALLMAPGTTNRGNDWAMVLVNPPDRSENTNELRRRRIKVQMPPKVKSGNGKTKPGTKRRTDERTGDATIPPIDTDDGSN